MKAPRGWDWKSRGKKNLGSWPHQASRSQRLGRYRSSLAAALLFALPCLTQSSLAFTREDPPDPNYLIGYLAWNEGQGTITWAEGSSEDPGGPTQAGEKNIYISDPLPKTLYVNGSRLIQVDLMLPGLSSSAQWYYGSNACYNGGPSQFRLYAGETFLGGSQEKSSFVTTATPSAAGGPGKTSFPPDPPGYGVCRQRIVAEAGVLTQGMTIRLDLGGSANQFGMAGDHHSVIRIPYFSNVDVLYRYPSYAHNVPVAVGGTVSLGETFAGLGLTAASLGTLLFPPGRRSRAGAICLLFVLGTLAGCTADPSHDGNTGAGDVELADLEPVYQTENISQQGKGSLIGDVKASDDARSLRGVHVALLGTSNATTTDQYGRFLFKDLDAGPYRLRADLVGYRSFEGLVTVVEDLIARVSVDLVPVTFGPHERAHLHDYWQEKTTLVLMNKERVDCAHWPSLTGFFGGPSIGGFGNPCVGRLLFRIPPPPPARLGYNSVLPGTYEVNVTLDWDPASVGYSTVGLNFQANNDPAFDNWSSMIARGPGEPFRIVTSWEMDDPGHQRFSSWAFSIFPYAPVSRSTESSLYSQSDALTRSTNWPHYLVTITIRKGVVPLEPAHGDFWQGANVLSIIQDNAKPVEYYEDSGGSLVGLPVDWSIGWLPPRLLPPETKWVEVYANASRERSTRYDVLLYYHTALDGPPSAACWNDPNSCPFDSTARPSNPGSSAVQESYWKIPVEHGDADHYYAPKSFWSFGLQPRQDDQTKAQVNADAAAMGPLIYTLTVIAHRDPIAN